MATIQQGLLHGVPLLLTRKKRRLCRARRKDLTSFCSSASVILDANEKLVSPASPSGVSPLSPPVTLVNSLGSSRRYLLNSLSFNSWYSIS